MYAPLRFYEICRTIYQHYKKSSLPFINSSTSFWYFCRRESKFSSIASFVSLSMKVSILAMRIHNTRFLRIFRRKKLIANVNLISIHLRFYDHSNMF